MKTTLLMAGIATALMVNMAEARAPGGADGPMLPEFSQLDADGNGQVTAEEMQAAMLAQGAERFAAVDTNSDGALSAEELTAAAEARDAERRGGNVERMISRMDTNEDGLLQMEEMQGRGEGGNRGNGGEDRMFARMDTNDDGMLSAPEYEAAKAFMAERGDRDGRGHGGN